MHEARNQEIRYWKRNGVSDQLIVSELAHRHTNVTVALLAGLGVSVAPETRGTLKDCNAASSHQIILSHGIVQS